MYPIEETRHLNRSARRVPSSLESRWPHSGRVARCCRRYGVRHLAVFGSMLRANFDPRRSDVDLAVEFSPATNVSPARQYFDFKAALERLFGRPVDLVELSAMPPSRLKRIIERTRVTLYGEPG